jgi:hypothetical protein
MSHHYTDSEFEAWHLPHMHHCANDAEWPDTQPAGCNKNCNQGRACDCVDNIEAAEGITPYDVETSSPWMALLYALVIVLAFALSALYPYPWWSAK